MNIFNPTGIERGQYGATGHLARLLGFEFWDDYINALTDVQPVDSRKTRKRLVKNSQGGALLPGQLVTWKTGKAGQEVATPAATAGVQIVGVVDFLLPATGVPDTGYFWIYIEGPCKFLLDANATSAEFDCLINSASVAGCVRTGTTSGAIVGRNETSGTTAAGGGTLANATLFAGTFQPN
jgi:hypothetical protein